MWIKDKVNDCYQSAADRLDTIPTAEKECDSGILRHSRKAYSQCRKRYSAI